MKLTIIVGEKGEIVGAFEGHSKEIRSKPGLYAIPVPGPGQTFHELEVAENLFEPDASHEAVKKLPERLRSVLNASK